MPFMMTATGELEHVPVPGEFMMECRKQFGMSRIEFGQLLGFTGENRNIYSTVKRYEENRRTISPTVERLLIMLRAYHAEKGEVPNLDPGVLT